MSTADLDMQDQHRKVYSRDFEGEGKVYSVENKPIVHSHEVNDPNHSSHMCNCHCTNKPDTTHTQADYQNALRKWKKHTSFHKLRQINMGSIEYSVVCSALSRCASELPGAPGNRISRNFDGGILPDSNAAEAGALDNSFLNKLGGGPIPYMKHVDLDKLKQAIEHIERDSDSFDKPYRRILQAIKLYLKSVGG